MPRMPRPTVATPAQQSRDAGLSRLRRLTWWTAGGAAGLTVVASLIAANTAPGRPSTSTQAAAAVNPGTGSNTGGTTDGTGAGALNPPAQAPQPNFGNGPVAVSGSS